MSRAIALARGQAAALASMTDTCTIRRAGSASTDQSTGVRTPAYSTLYTGVCRVQQTLPISRPHDSGENFLLLARMDVQLPVSVTGLQVNDEVTVTAVGAGHDADLVGRVFLVRDLFHKSEPTARRVGVIERTAV
jgi:hypothetical protein